MNETGPVVVDANLLLYAKFSSFPQHERARSWLEDRLSGAGRVGLPWHSLLAFLRIGTNARVFTPPLSSAAAWDQVQEWLHLPQVWIPLPTDRHAEVLGQLLDATGATANLIPDSHLAALAVEHGLKLCSTDGDFARFTAVRWQNPLA